MPISHWNSDEIDAQELHFLLRNHFPQSDYGKDYTRFMREDEELLRIFYSKKGRIKEVVRNSSLSDAEISIIDKKIEDCIVSRSLPVWGRYKFFSQAPVSGWFRYKDLFQILPVPPIAPQPHYGADPHPGLIEVKDVGSQDVDIRSMRVSRSARSIELILTMLVPTIARFCFKDGPREWVYGDAVDGQIVSSLKSKGYHYADDGHYAGGFTATDDIPPIERIDSDEFYNNHPHAFHVGRDLVFPKGLEQSLDKVFALSANKKNKLLRACYWLNTSRNIHRDSASGSYVALVSAIEAIMDDKRGPPCPTCSKPTGDGPTKTFRDFIETHTPGVPEAMRKQFYDVRSNLSHGGTLLAEDEEVWSGGRMSMYQGLDFMNLNSVVRAAVLNWLATQ